MGKKIYILSRYNVEELSKQDRVCYMSCMTKLDYVMSAIKSCGFDIEILSSSNSRNKVFCPSKTLLIDDKIFLHLSPGFKWKGSIGYHISNYLYLIILFFNVLVKVPYKGTLLVYHSCFHMEVAYLIKKIKRVKLIIEVEEIFGDVCNNEKQSKKELTYFQNANAYIFPTIMLNEIVNLNNIPYGIAHGTYSVALKMADKFDDEKIHIIYAGTFDDKKAGATAAIATASYLDSKYHIHICGFGTDDQINKIKTAIDEANKLGKATLSYEGLLKGKEYISMLQKCHIGLSTQDPTAKFNGTSFPSKILSYMSNGLRVVSVNIPAIKTADIGDYMYYYDIQNGEEIAKAIYRVNLSTPYDSRKILKDLNTSFINTLSKLLNSINA